jgi:hypothetical protein
MGAPWATSRVRGKNRAAGDARSFRDRRLAAFARAAAAQHLRAALPGDDAQRAGARASSAIQPERPGMGSPEANLNPPLYPIGCANRITQFETDDGRYLSR